ncbi:MAG: hypothetical protein VX733_07485 [Candidatus Latescibacterota bacterium]|nr:hypothetical protein [Candidatus Latescibacterota bacterium]
MLLGQCAVATATAAALLASGCASRVGPGSLELVEFRAPTLPDPEIFKLLKGTTTLGVLSSTNIEPVQSLDIEKVMGRLTDAVAHGLHNLSERKVVTQDEIRWHFREMKMDSAMIFSDSLQTAMQDEMEIDAIVHVALRGLEAQMTPMSPTPYGGIAPSPGVNLSVDLELMLLNLKSGESWRQQGKRSNWQPMQLNILGPGDRSEQQLLSALSTPLRQFLARVAPPPKLQGRHFDVSGD